MVSPGPPITVPISRQPIGPTGDRPLLWDIHSGEVDSAVQGLQDVPELGAKLPSLANKAVIQARKAARHDTSLFMAIARPVLGTSLTMTGWMHSLANTTEATKLTPTVQHPFCYMHPPP
jgi:hypothetical protein